MQKSKIMQKFVVSLLFLGLIVGGVWAEEAVSGIGGEATPAAEVKKSVDYVLPYPGILPDNPLYVLKMVRDRVMGWMIRDAEKKTIYNLLMADKRLAAAKTLWEYGKKEMAEQTASKAEKYFLSAVKELEKIDKKSVNFTNAAAKMSLANLKHKEILEQMKGTSEEKLTGGLENSLEMMRESQEKIQALMEVRIER